jgi:hypothetical protein
MFRRSFILFSYLFWPLYCMSFYLRLILTPLISTIYLRLWRLTQSYDAKDAIFWQKKSKTIVIRIIVLDDNIQIYSYGLLYEFRLEHVISTENDHRHHHKFIKYEKRLRKEGKHMFGLPIKLNLCHFSGSLDV